MTTKQRVSGSLEEALEALLESGVRLELWNMESVYVARLCYASGEERVEQAGTLREAVAMLVAVEAKP